MDSCSGKSLTPNESCEVEVHFTPTQDGMSHYQAVMHYANNVVLLSQQVTASAGGGGSFVSGQVVVALLANMLFEYKRTKSINKSIFKVLWFFSNYRLIR
jgi:hypothetical protein